MPTVKMDFSEDVFSSLRRSPEEFAREMRLAAAIYWYARGEVSQEKAAQIAGMRGRGQPLHPSVRDSRRIVRTKEAKI